MAKQMKNNAPINRNTTSVKSSNPIIRAATNNTSAQPISATSGIQQTTQSIVPASNSTLGNQYTNVVQDLVNMRGRLVIQFNPLDYYITGTPDEGAPFIPFENEGVFDKDGNLYVYLRNRETDVLEWVSITKELRDQIQRWIDGGVIENHTALVENGQIFRLFADNNNRVVTGNTEIAFPTEYRFYAIREIETDPITGFNYVAGFTRVDANGNTEVVTYLQNMEERVSQIDGVSRFCVIGPGNLLTNLENGKRYMLEFYNSSLLLVENRVYQAIISTYMDGIITPDDVITGLDVRSNRDLPNRNGVYLFLNEDPNRAFVFRVFLLYGSTGFAVDITKELESGGRLTIEGLDELDTNVLTSESNLNQSITFIYNAQKTNGGVDQNTNDGSLTISGNRLMREIPVIVEEDTAMRAINRITPISWIEGDPISSSARILMGIYGIYEDGFLRDINNATIQNLNSPTMNFELNNGGLWEAPQDRIGLPTESIDVDVREGSSSTLKRFTFTLKTNQRDNMVTINDTIRLIDTNSITNRMSFRNTTSTELITRNRMILRDGSIRQPTHFTVRNGKNFSGIFAERIDINNFSGFTYSITQGNQPLAQHPFIVVFEELVVGSQGQVTSSFITNAELYFAALSN